MTDNILTIIILPLLIAVAVVAECLHLICEGLKRVAGLLRYKSAPVYATGAEDDL